MSQRASALRSLPSTSLGSFFAWAGAAPPTLLVEKNSGSNSSKSRS